MIKKRFSAILLAAGNGTRTKRTIPKQYESLAGKAIINYSLESFIASAIFDKIIVVIQYEYQSLCSQLLGKLSEHITFVEGGTTRQESSLNALKALSDDNIDYVFIHDSARPFISTTHIIKLTKNLTATQGAILAVATHDTIKQATSDCYIKQTILRHNLYNAQTPQVFPYLAIKEAHIKASIEQKNKFTDDSEIAEYYGINMKIIEGTASNIKITNPIDFIIGEAMARQLYVNSDNN